MKGKTARLHRHREPGRRARSCPPLDAEFARALGVENGDVERLQREVRDNIEKEVDKRVKAKVKDQVMDALLASATFDLPRSLLDHEIAAHAAGRRRGPEVSAA